MFAASANADRLTDAEKQFCSVLGQYAWIVAHGRFAQGITKEQMWPYLDQNNDIHPAMEQSIRNLIETVYGSDFPLIEDAASIAAFSTNVNLNCASQMKKN